MPEHAFRVSQRRNVGIVRDEDHLPASFDLANAVDDRLEDEAVVEIVLRLIDEQRVVAVEQQDRQDGRAFLARR